MSNSSVREISENEIHGQAELMFNCPDGAYQFKVEQPPPSHETLVKMCIENNISETSTGLTFVSTTGSNFIHLTEVTFHNNFGNCALVASPTST